MLALVVLAVFPATAWMERAPFERQKSKSAA
jgi:hypothetical protein